MTAHKNGEERKHEQLALHRERRAVYVRRDLRSILSGEADDWRQSLLERYAEATISKYVKRARQIFKAAMRKGLATRPALPQGIICRLLIRTLRRQQAETVPWVVQQVVR